MSTSGERVLCGFHAVLARLRADPAGLVEIMLDERRDDARVRDLLALAQRAGVRVMRVDAARLDGVSGGARHQGVAARARTGAEAHSLDDVLDAITTPPFLLALDGVTDPHNLGACLRVANAAGVDAVIAPRDRSAGLTPVAAKVASGAAGATPYLMVTNLVRTLDELKERNIWVVGTDPASETGLFEADLPEAIVWVLGAEGHGMRRLTRETCDLLVRIPMRGVVDSLNVSVAAGLVLFETVRRRALPAPRASG